MNKGFLLLLGFLFTLHLDAQESPKIGLALSGGGAKGMAHIGVLRVLEEAGVRPDYISGTSMGAIVGAMYAIGYTPDEIEHYLKAIDWDALLANEFPRHRLSYLDRPTEDRYLVSFAVDSSGLNLPPAVNFGQYVLRELGYLMHHVHGQNDFSKFQIPFCAVATDLETGEAVVFNSGDIVDVLRATSSFPSLFSPHEIDGRLYVDGGVSNNLPITLLKEKGMDIIIAVDAQDQLYKKDELKDIIRILEQVGSFKNKDSYEEQIKDADLIIRPKVQGMSIVNYNISDSIVKLGEKAARLHMDQLRSWGSSVNEVHTSGTALPLNRFLLSAIEIEGTEKTTNRFVISKINLDVGDSVDVADLKSGIEILYGSQFYNSVQHRILPLDSGGYKLTVAVDERRDDQLFRLGVHYDDNYKMGVLLNATVRNAIMKNSKFSVDVVLSENPRGSISYIFERGFIPALGFRSSFSRIESRIYTERNVYNTFNRMTFATELFLHATMWDLYTLGGGVRLINIDLDQPIINFETEASNRSYLNYFAFLNFDSFDRIYKPKRGFQLMAEAKIISEQIDFKTYVEPISTVSFRYNQAISFGEKLGLNARIFGATTIGPEAPYAYSIFFGGMGENYPEQMFPFIGYNYMELFGRNAVGIRGDLWFMPIDNHYFTALANIGRIGTTIDELYYSDVLLDGYGLSYGFDSPIGPLELYVMKSTNHNDVLTYVRLGYWF